MTISRIYASSWKEAYRGIVPQKYLDELKEDFWKKPFQNWITNKSLKADILYADNIPVGCVAYGKSRDDKLPDWGEIVSIYIHPDFYRQGYGVKLLNTALQNFRTSGYPGCYLWVLSENLNAQEFYEANGFIATKDTCHSEIMGKQLTDIRYLYHFENNAK